MNETPTTFPNEQGLIDPSLVEHSIRETLTIEIAGLEGLKQHLDASLQQAMRWLLQCHGKVVVTGMGKSGHIGRKMAATFASTGTPAFFLHPGEGLHGDLGMVQAKDLVLALSNSGETPEVLSLLPPLRRIGVSIIAMTGKPASQLARRADLHLNVGVQKEACPLNLAPTASTTALLAFGDALAVCLLKLRGFRSEDFALFHPGGNLGKKLMTTVADLMDKESRLPCIAANDSVQRAVEEIEAKGYGVTAVVNAQGSLCGAFSLGDLMRLHAKHADTVFLSQPVEQVMNPNPTAIPSHFLAARALNTMEGKKIRAIFVTNPQKEPIGIVGIYEILKAIDY